MSPVIGMKVDTYNSKAVYRVCLQVLVSAVCTGVLIPVGQAEDLPAGLVDPTRPSYGGAPTEIAEQQPTGPVLQSTFVSTSQRHAVISGKSYRVGDKLGAGVITNISPYEVVLTQAGRETRLRLLPKVVKQAYVVKVPTDGQESGNYNHK